MSLINDVLRDLERRRQSSGDVLRGVRANDAGPPRWRVIVWLLPLAAVVSAGGWFAAERFRTGSRVEAPPPAAAAPAPAEPARVSVPAPAVMVNTVSLTQSARGAHLVFGLSGQVTHRVERSTNGKRLTVRLEGARLGTALPPLAAPEGALRGFDVSRERDDLLLGLDFVAPARAQTVLESRDEATALVVRVELEPGPEPIALEPPAPAVAAAPPPPAPAPRPAEFQKAPARLSGAEQAAQSYDAALRHLQRGQTAAAEAALAAALQADEEHAAARRTLAAVLAGQGRSAEAERLLAEGVARAPRDSELAGAYGRLLVSLGRDSEALPVLEAAVPANVGDGEYFALLAALYQRLGRYADSAAIYGEVLRAYPDRGVWWVGLGISLEAAGETARARDAYRRALTAAGLSSELRSYAEDRARALAGG